MELVLGGRACGKTDYVREKYKRCVLLAPDTSWEEIQEKARILPLDTALVLERLHEGVRIALECGKDQEEILAFLTALAGKVPSLVVITDEIGCGIVPLDPFARHWREVTGRIGTELAKQAGTVTRIQCGIPQILKCAPHPQQEILLLRHGKTSGNLERRYIGRTDEPLCPEGRQELMERHRDLPTPGPDPLLYVSPLLRCRESAALLFPGLPEIPVPDLREIDFGRFEGKSAEDLSGDPAYQAWIDSGGTLPFPEGEARDHFEARTDAAFWRILQQDPEEQPHRLVFVVHGGTIMSVLSLLTGKDYYDFQVPNGDGYQLMLHRENGCVLVDSLRRLS
ncbi:MAG: bifunctional adenosylcobinamide kinase/adenosylcobinamide-phosphate guanylyltransferase [Lachnospiraceae bacterium]